MMEKDKSHHVNILPPSGRYSVFSPPGSSYSAKSEQSGLPNLPPLGSQLTLLQRDSNGLTAENSELKLRLQTMEQQVHLQDALKEEIQHLKVLTGQGMANGGAIMNFPVSYGANQQYFPNNHVMNTLLTAQQLQQLQLHSQKQQQHQFQQHQLHQFQQHQQSQSAMQQQEKQLSQSADMKLRSSLQSSMEKDRASDSSSKVFELLREQLWYKPNAGIYVKLITMLGKCKQPEIAHTLFQAMTDEGCVVDREAYTALMSAYSRSGLFDRAFSILDQMKTIPDCRPDVFTYSILIKSCLQVYDFGAVKSLLSEMEMQGVRPNTVTYNTLIDAYGKSKKFAEMESVIVQMLRQPDCQPDVWTMNSTLRAFGGSGQIDMMEKCYEKFQKAGIEPSIKTFNILLDAYGKTEDYKKMSAVMQYMQRYHFSWTLVTYNIVIDAFGRAGDIKQMEFLFRLMQSERVKPNCVTLCSLVRAYANAGKAEKIASVLRYADSSDVRLDTVFFNCLIDAYGLMGCIAEMRGVVEMMKRRGCSPDKVTCRTMIKAYSMNGMTGHAKELQKELGSF